VSLAIPKAKSKASFDQAQGTAENLYGQAKDAASSAAEGVRKTASSFEDIFRRTIEDKPYTAIAIALGLGWLRQNASPAIVDAPK
jgi:ElaB/YqjD/DUF883 family membrane-anchored ribosome-binding protein